MRYSLILLSLLALLSACTWWGTKSESKTSPYPSMPLGISGEGILLKESKKEGKSYTVKGTEPFWSVDVSGSKAILTRPGNSGSTTETFITEQDDKWGLVTIRSIKGDFFVNLTKWSCSDGMSDVKYLYNASVLVGAETLKWCATE